jgi:hypothetical protein
LKRKMEMANNREEWESVVKEAKVVRGAYSQKQA